jgi:MSHA biogenesis protein MshP
MKMHQKGFGLIAAMFILVVIASAAAMMLNITQAQDRTSLLMLQSARAYYAAEAGLEWGLKNVSTTPSNCTLIGGTLGALTLSEGSLNGFTATVTCIRTRYDEAGTTVQMLRVESEATFGNTSNPDYVRRKVSATIPL